MTVTDNVGLDLRRRVFLAGTATDEVTNLLKRRGYFKP